MNHSEIIKEVGKVRKIFDENHKDLSEIHFGNFPNGACGNTCSFLAQWLFFKGVSDVRYIYGQRDGRSHAWLEVGDYIVDITSDQFSDGVGPVYINTSREFHNKFGEQREGNCSISPVMTGAFN